MPLAHVFFDNVIENGSSETWMQKRWLNYRSCFSDMCEICMYVRYVCFSDITPICVIRVLGQLGYLLKITVKAQDVGWWTKGCRIALLQQHRLKLWKEGSRPSTRLMPKKASAQHIILPMCTLDFKIPVAKLLKNPPPFVSQSLHPLY